MADDHQMLLDAFKVMLEPEFDVVGTVTDGRALLKEFARLHPDVVVIDVAMPLLNGLDAARQLKAQRRSVKLIFVTMNPDPDLASEALRLGASGYVLKSVANRDLIEACRATMRGEPFLYPAAVRALVRDYLERASRGEATPEDPLSPRELEVVKLIAEGLTSEEIGEQLFISKKTVDRHRENVLEKLGMRNRVELTRYAIRRGLVTP